MLTPILSPLAWDLGHIANFEEQWLVRRVGGLEPLDRRVGDLYDAIANPRATRGELPILRGDQLRDYMRQVRERALTVLEGVELDDADPLLRDGFVYEMLIAHEHQHAETMLQLLQMVEGYEPARRDPRPGREPAWPGAEMLWVEGGELEVGAGVEGFAYDNERPRHTVELAPFWIDRSPVSNGEYAAFVAETGAQPPLHWRPDAAGGWIDAAMGRADPVDPERAVCHVDWHAADAYARWAGKRLPSELEWEAAAVGADPGRANLGGLAYGTARAGAYADAPSGCGAVQMLGDVWEWTSSVFTAYPGFEPFPYPDYSQAFFEKGYRVLRGGSWATDREVIRTTFRNWDLPERRQIFAGIRCARDA